MPEPLTIPFSPPQDPSATTARIWLGDGAATTFVLAHGAGTDMSHRSMVRHATDLHALGHTAVLFDFAYTAGGRRRPDPPARLESAWRDVIRAVRTHLRPAGPFVIGGRSMGGRIATMVAAAGARDLGVDGVVAIAYPLHPPGRPDSLRTAHWPDLTVPVLLVGGDRDAMAPTAAMLEQVAAAMPPGLASVHHLAGADHSFRVRVADGRSEDSVFEETAGVMSGWAAGLGGSAEGPG